MAKKRLSPFQHAVAHKNKYAEFPLRICCATTPIYTNKRYNNKKKQKNPPIPENKWRIFLDIQNKSATIS